MKKQFYIDSKYARKPKLIVQIDGVYLDLKGKDSKEKTRDSKAGPGVEVEIKGATQEDLQNIFENPDTYGDFSRVIKVRETTAVAKKATGQSND